MQLKSQRFGKFGFQSPKIWERFTSYEYNLVQFGHISVPRAWNWIASFFYYPNLVAVRSLKAPYFCRSDLTLIPKWKLSTPGEGEGGHWTLYRRLGFYIDSKGCRTFPIFLYLSCLQLLSIQIVLLRTHTENNEGAFDFVLSFCWIFCNSSW